MAKQRKEAREHYRRWLAGELGKYGRSQSALARHLGIHQSAVNRMVSGARSIKLEEQDAIEEYLEATDPNPPETGAQRRPDDAASASQPLEAYPDLLRSVLFQRATEDDVKALLHSGNDYAVVMTSASTLAYAVTATVAELVAENAIERTHFGDWWWDGLVEKTEAAVRNGRITESQGARMLAIFAIRDAFAHSLVTRSLLDETVRPLTEQAISYGYMHASQHTERMVDDTAAGRAKREEMARMELVVTASTISHQLLTNDPAKTAAMLFEAVNEVFDQDRES